jgi:ADP-heptose:LPS heptosyltransferase
MGINYHFSDRLKYVPEIVLDENEKQKICYDFSDTLKKEKMNSDLPYIFIHPGMGPHSLNWSSRNYGRLILKLEQKFPKRFNFVISHTPSDYYSLQGVKDVLEKKENAFLNDRVYFFNGQIKGLRHLLNVLSQAKLYIGPSTGMTHAAATLSVPVVALFSPIKAQSAQRWSPITQLPQKLRISVPDVICGEVLKCAERACPYYECMGKIEVDDIVKNAVAVLEI